MLRLKNEQTNAETIGLREQVRKLLERIAQLEFTQSFKVHVFGEQKDGIALTSDKRRKILACLHPDSRKSLSDERLAEAFRIFNALSGALESKRS